MAHRPHKNVLKRTIDHVGPGRRRRPRSAAAAAAQRAAAAAQRGSGERAARQRWKGKLPGRFSWLRIHVCSGTLTTDYREFNPVNIEIQP